MKDIHLYSGYFSNNSAPFRFELSDMPVERVYEDGTIETKCPYFTSPSYSTNYFGGKSGNGLEKEYQLTFGKAFYSTDKEKCREWLEDKLKTERARILKEYDAIISSKIIDKGVDGIE